MASMKDFYGQGTYEHWKNGDPSKLAETLRSDTPLSSIARHYLADLLEGRVNRRPGRKRKDHIYGNPDTAAVTVNRIIVCAVYEAEKAELGKRGKVYGNDIEREAIENTAEKLNMKEGEVSHLLYPRHKKLDEDEKPLSRDEIMRLQLPWRKQS